MVVAVVAVDVFEKSSSSGSSVESAELAAPSCSGTQASASNNNNTDKTAPTTVQEAEANNNTPVTSNTSDKMTDAGKGKSSDSVGDSTKAVEPADPALPTAPTKSAVSQRNVDIKIEKIANTEPAGQQLTKKVLKLDLGGKSLDEYSLKSPKSPIAARVQHQTSLTSSVDVEDRKTLRDALYQGIFHRHRRTIFAVGSFLRMLRSRNSQYNTIRSSSEGEDIDEVR
ncbi:GL18233 [Drosophila persimilis]|uniref:GL18233 n=1 Tax=Drosophila persimilis TaxID=7234 RepID=B4H4H2_DROPE|nr:GL18233 [Drosophila persimilis]